DGQVGVVRVLPHLGDGGPGGHLGGFATPVAGGDHRSGDQQACHRYGGPGAPHAGGRGPRAGRPDAHRGPSAAAPDRWSDSAPLPRYEATTSGWASTSAGPPDATTRPWSRATSRSATDEISEMSCSMMSKDAPSRSRRPRMTGPSASASRWAM